LEEMLEPCGGFRKRRQPRRARTTAHSTEREGEGDEEVEDDQDSTKRGQRIIRGEHLVGGAGVCGDGRRGRGADPTLTQRARRGGDANDDAGGQAAILYGGVGMRG